MDASNAPNSYPQLVVVILYAAGVKTKWVREKPEQWPRLNTLQATKSFCSSISVEVVVSYRYMMGLSETTN